MLADKSNFCILPWIHAATHSDGSVILCCVAGNTRDLNLNTKTWAEIWNSEHFKSARLHMLEGKQFPACNSCWKEEATGIRSHRQNENVYWSREIGEDQLQKLVDATKVDGSIDTDIITVDFRLGNTCNLQCIMCRPQDSSKWLQNAKTLANELQTDAKWDWKYKANIVLENFNWYKNQEFWDSFYETCGNIRHIIFGGGEPLLIKEHKTLIQELVRRGFSENIEIRYHTNGTILDEDMIELWTKFKKVEVMISLDGHKDINDFVRYPADWSTIEKNLALYDNTPDMIDPKILCTVQALNIEWLPEFSDWLLSQNYKKISKKHHGGMYHHGILHWPQYYCVKVLPLHVKDRITKKLNDYSEKHRGNICTDRFKGLIEFMNSEDWSSKLNQTYEVTEKIQNIRNIKYKFWENIS
jgi:sulfatase maturation enzyme AslB (radical SAM superfamily)